MTEQTTTDETTAPEDVAQTTDEQTSDEQTEEGQTFDLAYVQKLRQEAAQHRTKAKDRDTLAQRLHVALVAATGRLADPSDLPYDDTHLTDEGALTAALDALVARKPHLASRTPRGDVGQGMSVKPDTVSLAGLLRARA